MSLIDLELFSNWWNKGVCIHQLKGIDLQRESAIRHAISSYVVGLLFTAVLEFAVIWRHNPKISFSQIIGLPIFALVPIVNLLFFVLVLFIGLVIMRARPSLSLVASVSCLAFSVAMPLITLFSIESFNLAIELFVKYRDPSNPYLSSSTYLLLTSQEAAKSVILRNWFFSFLCLAVFAWYVVFNVVRLLVQSTNLPRAGPRVWVALLSAFVLDVLFLHIIYGRVYWLIISALLRT